jgi:RNA polymerase sigma-70 factor (ECF subfamily)
MSTRLRQGLQTGQVAMQEQSQSFLELLERLKVNDEAAASAIYRRYVHRLIALASHQLGATIRAKADPESIVQSVYRSFFEGQREDAFEIRDWNGLWSLLVVITLRKCANRKRYHRREKRDASLERSLSPELDESGGRWELADPRPTPYQAAVLTETIELVLRDLGPRERKIIELLLAGCTIDEVRQEVGCGERTVRRVRDRVRHEMRAMQIE